MKTRNELLRLIADSPIILDYLDYGSGEGVMKIEAVKEIRNQGGVPLRESKEACDAWQAGYRYEGPDAAPSMPLEAAGWLVRNMMDRSISNSLIVSSLERQALKIASDMACNTIDLGDIVPSFSAEPYDEDDED